MTRYYWKCRLRKGCCEVPVVTWFGPPIVDGEELDRSPRWQCFVGTEEAPRQILFGDATPIEVDGITLLQLEHIDAATYKYMIDYAKWASTHAPHLPQANPYKKVEKLKEGTGVW